MHPHANDAHANDYTQMYAHVMLGFVQPLGAKIVMNDCR